MKFKATSIKCPEIGFEFPMNNDNTKAHIDSEGNLIINYQGIELSCKREGKIKAETQVRLVLQEFLTNEYNKRT